MAEDNPFQAAWSRSGNLLCHGHWIIHYNGEALELPEPRREKDMGTWAIYNIMDPDDEIFAQGLKEDEWIIENVEWLTDLFFDNGIPLESVNYRAFYQAINPHDWRCTSCAGCM
ncbi:hypothetical protein [Lelliottia amnigena]|uniref:hypothetical protein n=1 Tax=Lelliottia amnigena TaxID=61646 RepID=UPI002B221B9D|nr:hypothetical protein [Lelliottia amnigena]MEA9394247.1 hypothetical protein [Lelliottia amnigena]